MKKHKICKSGHKPKGRKRLIDLEVDEFSMVDKPAIDETFILAKRLGMKEKEIIKAELLWGMTVEKVVDTKNTHCKFCNISSEEEAKSIGAGLLCSVCFNCAVERIDKDVFDQCLDGNFDFDKYKEDHPDEFTKDDNDEDDDNTEDNSNNTNTSDKKTKKHAPLDDAEDEVNEERREARSKKFGIEEIEDAPLIFQKNDPRKLSDYGDPVNLKFPIENLAKALKARVRFKQFADTIYSKKSSRKVIHNRIVKRELSLGIKPIFDPEDNLDDLLDLSLRDKLKTINKGGGSMKKKLKKLTKNVSELKEMLERSLALHDQAASALNEIVVLNMASIEALATIMSGEASKGKTDGVPDFTLILEQTKKFRKECKKAGKKISAGRLKELREIAEKLAELIASVGTKKAKKDAKEDGETDDETAEEAIGQLKKLTDSVEALTKAVDDAKKKASDSDEKLAKRIDDLETTSGASASGDEDDDEDEDDDHDTEKSLFADVVGINDIKTHIRKRAALINRSNGGTED